MINAFLSNPIIQRLQRQDFRPCGRLYNCHGGIILSNCVIFCFFPHVELLIIVLPIGIGIVLLFLRYPSLGIIAIIPASFIIPLEIGVSSGSSLNAPMIIIILMTGLWMVDMLVIKRQIRFSQISLNF